ncbi:hypothetical protein F5Y18DRAFT_424719 [Xylariaceae sp. FL1019]|nr:hypothetical protein F5Y18DRAFT_424719 [Xylariaceae sp. FL1019]
MKSEIQLKIMGLDYRQDTESHMANGQDNRPTVKLPYIIDGDVTIADSHFPRLHLEKKYGKDLGAGLTDVQKATAERLVEDSLYWAMVHSRFFLIATTKGAPMLQTLRDRALELRPRGLDRHSLEEILA